MNSSRFVLLLVMTVVCVWLSVISTSRVHVMNSPAVSSAPPTAPDFQTVLQALKQRNNMKPLPEPEVVTTHCSAVNRSYYNEIFTLPVTNK